MDERFAPLPSQVTAPNPTRGIRLSNPLVGAAPLLGAVVTLLIMLSLKRHYSLATTDQLDWILAPTAKMVAWLTPAHPVHEYGVGYVDFAQGIIVAPACAGVNFMIMAFGLTAFCGLIKMERLAGIFIWLPAALGCAYGYTILVNAVRIAISMHLYHADLYSGWLTMARLHRLSGIGLYLGALWLFFMGLQAIVDCCCKRLPRHIRKKGRTLPGWLPFGWYLTGAVGVPLANLLFQHRAPSLVEHCLTVGITVIIISTITWAAKGAVRHLRQCPSRLIHPKKAP